MPFTEPSQETYAIFGRLTVAFGRLEGTVDWLMALLIMHTDRERSVSPRYLAGATELEARRLEGVRSFRRSPVRPSRPNRRLRPAR